VTDTHTSDSAEQRALEAAVLPLLSEQYGVELTPATLDLGEGVRPQVDGVSADRNVLVEFYGHVGPLKGGQPKKLVADAFKLVWLGRRLGATVLVIAVVDQPAYSYLTNPRGWAAAALRDFGVTVTLVALDAADHARIVAVQARQAEGMRGSGPGIGPTTG